jgi:hypothetical protein
MSAHVLPFPRLRDRNYVLRHAARMAAVSERAAEKHLATQLDVQRATMARRGIASELIEKQIHALELAIRCELWREILTPDSGGAA